MKAFKIDCEKQEVYEVDYDATDYKETNKQIGCHTMSCAIIFDKEDGLMVDDEGLLGGPTKGFNFRSPDGIDWKFAGNGVLIGCDKDGNSQEVQMNLEEFKKMVTGWMDKKALQEYKDQLGI